MIFHPTSLPGCYTIELTPYRDERGWFARWYCKEEFARIGHAKDWLQMNHSFTAQQGTVRGMHFQKEPFSEIKLVRCVAGAVFDVVVDLRRNSSTFLKWMGVEISAANGRMMYIPEGFAHGFQCLSDNCELLYAHSEFYVPGSEGGIRYNDPRIKIDWPLPVTVVSERDAHHPLLDDHFKGL
jgi:dTDP-4-dehydrorhamnose 3,5-epimerase